VANDSQLTVTCNRTAALTLMTVFSIDDCIVGGDITDGIARRIDQYCQPYFAE